MREINKIADALFEKIRDRFEDVSLGDENAKATNDPESARFFNFDYAVDGENYGNITMSLIDEKSLKVYYSKNITEKLSDQDRQKWYAFLRELREFARRNLLSFEPRDITRGTLKYRDIHQQSRADGTFGTDEVVSESRMYGTVNRSYESFGPVRIKLKHNKPIVDEAPGARSRNIDAIFLENDQGERFRLPFNNLSGARAMARHVSAGGVPNDELGCHITNIVKEMTALRPFVFGMRNRKFEDVTTNDMVESAFEYHGLLKNTLKKLRGRRGYTEFKENFKPALNETDVDVESLKEKFVKRIFDDRLAEALPIVHRAYEMKQANTNPYLQAFEGWATKISEGVWAVPDSDEAQDKLQELLAEPLEVGVDAANATAALSDIIGDDELYDDLAELAEQDPASDARPLIQHWLRDNGYSNLAGEDQVEPEKNMHGSAMGGVNGTVNESHDSYEAVQAAIIRRIIHQHKDALAKYGPEAIMQAVEDEAAFVGDIEEIGSSDVSGWVRRVIQALESGQYHDTHSDVLESDATYDEDEEDYDEEDDEDQSFYVVLADEDGEVFVGSISKEDGRWRERRVSGKAPYGWSGSNYMSYLKPNDIMSWIRKDYERNYVIKGPFFDEESLHAATSWLQESQSKPRNFVAKNAPRTGAGAHKNKKKADRQGDVKHKKSAELEQQLSEDVSTDAVSVIVKEVIKLIGEGHTEVSPDVVTAKISAALGQPFMLKDLVAANNSSPELQHYIDSINPSKIKFSTDILTVKNQDPVRAKEKAQNGVASMAARAANRPGLSEGSTMGHTVGFMTMPDLKPGDRAHHGMLGPVTVVRHDGPRVVVRDRTRQLYRMSPHKLQPAEDATEDRKPSLKNPQDNPCWSGYHPVGTKKKNGQTVPNCVPKESINEETTADVISAALTAKGVTYSRDREEEIINMIGDEMKQQGMSGKNIRHLMSYDQDFIPDVLAGLARDVTEGFKNTYNVGDRVESPQGTGTITVVSKNVNVDGRVKVKLDDPDRAGEDGKHKDTFVFTTDQLKHVAEQGVAEGYWQDAVKKAEASREARKGKPFEKNPASHDKQGVYKGDKDLAGRLVPKRKEQGVAEGEHGSRKPFGVRYKVFAGREGRVSTKEYWTTSEEKLQKAVAKIQALDNFYGIDGYSYPKEQPGVAEGNNESTVATMEKKLQAMQDRLELTRERRKMRGQRIQSTAEIKLAAKMSELRQQIHQLKSNVTESASISTHGTTSGGYTWRFEAGAQLKRRRQHGLAEAGPFSYGAKKPRRGSLRDQMARQSKKYYDQQPVIEPKDQMVGVAKVVKKGVMEGSFGSGYGSVFTLYVNTGEKSTTKTKTKKFKREDDAVYWAEDYADQHEMFPNLKMEIQDENGNVVWELEESQGVAEGEGEGFSDMWKRTTKKKKPSTPTPGGFAHMEKKNKEWQQDQAKKKQEQGVAEGSEIKIPTADGITMQDIRLMAGEGKLSQKTIQQAIAVIRKQRQPRQSVTEDHDQSIFDRYVLPALEKILGQDSAFDRLNQRAEDAIGKYVIPALERALGEGSTFDELNQKAEDLIGKYVIPFLRKIMGEESEQVAEARRPTDFATITIENPDDTGDIDLEVGYHTEGDYYPATRLEPASYPEIIIDSVRRTDTGAEILSTLDNDTYEYILNQLYDRQEQYEGVNEISDATKASYKKQAQKQVQDLTPHARTGEYRDMAKNIINKRQQGLARLGTVAENMLADYARELDSISEAEDGISVGDLNEQGVTEGSLNEFAISDNGAGDDYSLFNYAKMWYNGDLKTQKQVEKALQKIGLDIGENEDENGGAYISDMSGDYYESWTAEDFKQGVAEGLESLESLIGKRVYVKSVGEMGTVSDVSAGHRNSLIVDLDNGDREIAHFTDLSQERPGMMRRMMDKIKSPVAATAPLKESTDTNNSESDVAELRRLAGLK
jgi:hypothetical protein